MKKGFTVIEVIVAIFVITAGIVGVLSLVTQTISSVTHSKDKLIAAYLAQEGIEIVRNIRDTNWLEEEDWNNGISTASDYGLDYQSSEFPDTTCNLGPEKYLKYDGNFYNCSSGSDTKFKRKITVTPPGADILEVLVLVEWQEKGKTYEFETQETLYNWR